MDGFQVLKDLKSGAGTKDIPVIVLTNLESADDVGKVIALGATTYLVKSNYELGDIVAKIKEVLKKFPAEMTSIAIEATCNYYWLYELLDRIGFTVKLENIFWKNTTNCWKSNASQK